MEQDVQNELAELIKLLPKRVRERADIKVISAAIEDRQRMGSWCGSWRVRLCWLTSAVRCGAEIVHAIKVAAIRGCGNAMGWCFLRRHLTTYLEKRVFARCVRTVICVCCPRGGRGWRKFSQNRHIDYGEMRYK